jgi:hypothetical protein
LCTAKLGFSAAKKLLLRRFHRSDGDCYADTNHIRPELGEHSSLWSVT